jgi:tetratricopeptide (TPR) repeat protein
MKALFQTLLCVTLIGFISHAGTCAEDGGKGGGKGGGGNTGGNSRGNSDNNRGGGQGSNVQVRGGPRNDGVTIQPGASGGVQIHSGGSNQAGGTLNAGGGMGNPITRGGNDVGGSLNPPGNNQGIGHIQSSNPRQSLNPNVNTGSRSTGSANNFNGPNIRLNQDVRGANHLLRGSSNHSNWNTANGGLDNKTWNHSGTNWKQYGVAGYHQNWYRGSWSGFNHYYFPFGLGYGSGLSGFNSYGYGYSNGAGFGFGPFALNSLAYRWGYNSFYNPYWGSSSIGYNYAQPVYITTYRADSPQYPTSNSNQTDFLAARTAFRNQDYAASIVYLQRLIQASPTDSVAHEFLALNLFALGRYEESAAIMNSVLAVAPGWNWETLVSLYSNVSIYTQQLRQLEGHVREHSDDAASNFLLAYHYLVMNHPDVAKGKLQRVLELQPRDAVARQLLNGIGGNGQASQSASLPEPIDAKIVVGKQSNVVGTWKSTRDELSIDLTFQDDGKFVWTVGGDPSRSISGKYTLNDGTLVMEDTEGGVMVAHVTAASPDSFRFKMIGGPAEDTGMVFQRR